MFEVLTGLFDTTGFSPRTDTGAGWTPALVWLHVTSDLFIWLAYLSIPLVLLYFTRRRDLPHPRLFVLFALFILACGTTHLIDALTFEYPVHRFAGVMKFVTAVASWAAVVALIPVVPRVMSAVTTAAQPGAVTREHRALSGTERPKPTRTPAHIVAILAGVLAVLVRAAIDPLLQRDDHIFVVALLAVVYVSWQHGFGPGVVCLCIGVFGYAYFFVLPRYTLLVGGFGNQLALALFFFCGVACAALGEAQRQAGRRARVALATAVARGEELESEVVRRRVVESALRQREADLVAAQRETAEALARLNAFLDNAPLGIAFFDPDLRYVRVNTYLAAANGKPVEGHTGRRLTEVLPDFPPAVADAYRRCAGPDGAAFTAQFRRPDVRQPGAERVWRVTAFPVREPGVGTTGAGVIAQDVTAELKAEVEVRRSEQRFRSLAVATAQIVWTASPDGRIVEDSPTWREFTGQSYDEFKDAGWLSAVHPDDRERARVTWRAAVESRGGYAIEYRLRRRDGEYRWNAVRGVPVLEADGRIREWVGTCTDTHEQKAWATRVAEANLFLEATINALSSHIAVLDREGTILKVNEPWCRFADANGLQTSGYGVGTNYLAVCDAACQSEPAARLSDGIRAVIRGDRPSFRTEYPCHSPADRRWFQMRVTRFPGAGAVRVVVTHEDITVRVLAEEALRESEERFRSMADGVPALIWLSEPDGRRTYFNKTWLEFTGVAADRQLGYGWADNIHPDDRALYLRAYEAALADRRPFELEYRLRRRDGADRWVLARGTPLFTPSGGFAGFVGLCLDVTERREAEGQLRDSEAFRRSVFENSPDCLMILDPDGRVLEMNEAGCRLMELDDFGAIRGARWSELWPAANRETIREAVDAARAGRVGRFQGFCPTAKGTAKYWDVSVAAIPSADGAPERLIGVSRDVTEQRRAEDAVRASEQRFRTLTEAVPQMVWTADPKGEVTFFNRRWDEYTGAAHDPGRSLGWGGEQLHQDDADRFRSAWQLAVARGAESFSHEFRVRRSDGEYRWVLCVAVPLRDPTGAVSDWVGTLTDIDDQKRQTQVLERMVRERTAALQETNLVLTGEVAERKAAEEQVRAVAAELERSNDELEQFAYIASHDLQEPLRKIQAFGDRLQNKCRDKLPDNGKEYVDRMLSAAGRMRRLIDDLLTFSRVATQKRPFVRLDLGRLVREVVSDLDIRIGQADGTVRVGALPALEADPSQMRQLFQNLIVNAVKFHRPGVPPVVDVEGELVHLAPTDSDPAEPIPMYRVTVRDNGIGFDEKYRERIFNVFQRLHGRDEYEGTGVGLAICRKIAERHGGTITAQGREGEGATFVLLFPARRTNPREATVDDVQPEQADHDPDGR